MSLCCRLHRGDTSSGIQPWETTRCGLLCREAKAGVCTGARGGEYYGHINAVIWGVRKAKKKDPHHQFVLENPAWSALIMRFDKKLIKYFGKGAVVQGCTYGDRLTGKGYKVLDVGGDSGGFPGAVGPADVRKVPVRGMQDRGVAQPRSVPTELSEPRHVASGEPIGNKFPALRASAAVP